MICSEHHGKIAFSDLARCHHGDQETNAPVLGETERKRG